MIMSAKKQFSKDEIKRVIRNVEKGMEVDLFGYVLSKHLYTYGCRYIVETTDMTPFDDMETTICCSCESIDGCIDYIKRQLHLIK